MDAKAPRKWLLIGREFGVPSEEGGGDQWSLDHLFLDQDAIPTIVDKWTLRKCLRLRSSNSSVRACEVWCRELLDKRRKRCRKKLPSSRRTMNEAEFFRVLEEKTSPEEANVARMILDWSKKNFSYINWDGASFVPMLEYDSPHPFSPIDVRKSKSGSVAVRSGHIMTKNPPFAADDKRLDLLRRLNEIPGVSLPQDSISKFPQIPLSTLVSANAVEQFLKALAWAIEEVKAAQNHQPSDFFSGSARS